MPYMQTLVSESLHLSQESPHFSINQFPGRSHFSLKFEPSVSPVNVASRVFTRQNVDDARRTKGDHKSSP
ncbi:hypothetical protein DPMN_040043 [Dreissena polymorpha]|uniref:Uncharacterized protein n=1 Tax=Dreissena polymorpha TaxID=45954 RepID=A0A9D4CX23_DREPO|nr:hypothetical protein DPMN_040043 [Dreissena polymorpha]